MLGRKYNDAQGYDTIHEYTRYAVNVGTAFIGWYLICTHVRSR